MRERRYGKSQATAPKVDALRKEIAKIKPVPKRKRGKR